jgi:hypothetical protein
MGKTAAKFEDQMDEGEGSRLITECWREKKKSRSKRREQI